MKPKFFRIILTVVILSAGFIAESQSTMTIHGIITSFKTIPLNKVKVYAMKSGETAFSDSTGRFTVKISDKDLLVLTASGFMEKKVRTGKEQLYKINMIFVDNPTNVQAAVNKGHIAKNTLEKALNSVAAGNVRDYSKYNSIYQLIESEVYSVRVKGSAVYNKKIKSLDANPQVLYVVDDRIVTDISNINPVDVRSIEFVEDAGASAYGVKGANGVLKIRLK